jgi:hypothetical protein
MLLTTSLALADPKTEFGSIFEVGMLLEVTTNMQHTLPVGNCANRADLNYLSPILAKPNPIQPPPYKYLSFDPTSEEDAYIDPIGTNNVRLEEKNVTASYSWKRPAETGRSDRRRAPCLFSAGRSDGSSNSSGSYTTISLWNTFVRRVCKCKTWKHLHPRTAALVQSSKFRCIVPLTQDADRRRPVEGVCV